ncbi:solute carrier family 41 member 1-like [Pollicipes pollicipes]|uniref:solute carrier family 41 member 1-like n=1 Tax=Pollicipes pollicipes TaxID=41117 RepID=UPI00188498B9|nr:solute carrier family 41 member 1-like [Pollicipes pollicipes]
MASAGEPEGALRRRAAAMTPPLELSSLADDAVPLTADEEQLEQLADSEDGLIELRKSPAHQETWFSIAVQVFFPYLVAGFGMVGAGIVLDIVQHWPVFTEVTEVFILVPALLGLKGNLEMTLASRLSTHANLGRMDEPRAMWSLLLSNMGLIQCQAIVVGFLASTAAIVMGWIPDGEFNIHHTLLLCASSVVTASLASLVLGSVMIAVIVLSQRFSINPDNVATPIAASMGDLVTLALLSWIASLLHRAIEPDPWLAPTIIAVYLLLIPLFAWVSHRNQYTRVVLLEGWTPVIAAMLISSAGGLILDFAVSAYEGVAVFQPVINGVGGNLVAVQASRISTELHRAGRPGQRPRAEHAPLHVCLTPWAAFCQTGGHSRTARVLLSMVVPGHLVFTYSISYFRAGHTSLTPLFLVVYNCAAVLQVVVLLYVAHCMIHWMWKNGVDPDNSAIPYLTALGDLIGTGLLALAFQFLFIIGDRDSDLGD